MRKLVYVTPRNKRLSNFDDFNFMTLDVNGRSYSPDIIE